MTELYFTYLTCLTSNSKHCRFDNCPPVNLQFNSLMIQIWQQSTWICVNSLPTLFIYLNFEMHLSNSNLIHCWLVNCRPLNLKSDTMSTLNRKLCLLQCQSQFLIHPRNLFTVDLSNSNLIYCWLVNYLQLLSFNRLYLVVVFLNRYIHAPVNLISNTLLIWQLSTSHSITCLLVNYKTNCSNRLSTCQVSTSNLHATLCLLVNLSTSIFNLFKCLPVECGLSIATHKHIHIHCTCISYKCIF